MGLKNCGLSNQRRIRHKVVKMKPTREAFTLIELLIVVAIIGILAAIAVPNFLNAQMRAKVARCVSDLKALSNSMEMYRIDYNTYINESESYANPNGKPGPESGLVWLTELQYIAALPIDPFENKYATASGTTGLDMYEVAVAPANPKPIKKLDNINSRGPDQDEDMGARSAFETGAAMISYTPTNGLISDGDIYIIGGDPSVLKGPLIIDGHRYDRSYPATPRF